MIFSEKLNGYWEEGYHYYIEIRDDRMTVRDYRRRIMLETAIAYNAGQLDSGERTVISLSDNTLSTDGDGEPMTMIRELAYENGELKLLYFYTIMGETQYTLHKVDHGPFDHIIIRDDEYLESLQGVWEQWSPNGKGTPLIIKGNRISTLFIRDSAFRVVSYTHSPDKVYLVPEDFTEEHFSGMTRVEVKPDMLLATPIIMDMSMPVFVYARADMLDKITVPAGALAVPRNTMMPDMAPPMPMRPVMMKGTPIPTPQKPARTPQNDSSGDGHTCPECGMHYDDPVPKFCCECGAVL